MLPQRGPYAVEGLRFAPIAPRALALRDVLRASPSGRPRRLPPLKRQQSSPVRLRAGR
jgi:hypothetical protein